MEGQGAKPFTPFPFLGRNHLVKGPDSSLGHLGKTDCGGGGMVGIGRGSPEIDLKERRVRAEGTLEVQWGNGSGQK